MELSPEDTLRINVLLANKPLAIRIHESSMTLYGLSQNGEAQVKLNPNCRDTQYVKRVKETLSGHVLGSPGGYPVYLQRWTRMGQMRDDNLEQLLLLGEPEAVVAVVCAAGITDELARRAWWAMEDAENARRMLMRDAVSNGTMGSILANYLVEFLPFETEPEQMMMTVALVLRQGLISDEARLDLWRKSKRKTAYFVGFLSAIPDDLPEQEPETAYYRMCKETLAGAQGNQIATQFLRTMSPAGQAFLSTVDRVLSKPVTQEMVTTTLEVLASYFSVFREEGVRDQTLDELLEEAGQWPGSEISEDCVIIQQHCDDDMGKLRAMRILSGVNYGVVRPCLRDSTAIGSLMRRKLDPVIQPILEYIRSLRV